MNGPTILGNRFYVTFVGEDANGLPSQAAPSAADNADAQAVFGALIPLFVNRPQIWNGLTFDRLRSLVDNADGTAAGIVGLTGVLARGAGFNGATWDRLRTGSAANLAALSGLGSQIVVAPGQWTGFSDPAAAAQATVTRAAGGAGVRHICNSISASLSGGTVASGIRKVYLRDGAAGVGTILWAGNMQVAIAGSEEIQISGLSIVGSANTAMTLEFDAAAGVASQENVTMTGYDAS